MTNPVPHRAVERYQHIRAQCVAPLNGGLYCGRYCPPAKVQSS